MKPASAPNIRMTDRKKKAVLDAAVKEFIANGYDNTSMDMIATTANVSKRTVYHHFPSKEDLFAAIIDEMVNRIELVSEFSYDSKKSLVTQLNTIALEIVRSVSDVDFLGLSKVIVSRLMTAPEFSQFMSDQTARIDNRLAEWLRLAHADGRMAIKQPEVAAEQLMGLLLSYAFWPALLGIKKKTSVKPQKQYVKECVTMFVNAYAQKKK
ncbi:HTH-type transcriptional regulator RutR [Planctomycetes bacterium CA13]|uniref:HTH-type transcriptional regulator RutR n=1 Tax=Novipirellula herctigrandis TaxID=2527986 RepID=A0A5C5Z6D2_9BACT|nr:HTH-type transcriptional regulator RutR [Planctomycetes bacterium CA13]